MPFDGITLGRAARELNDTLAGGRVDRIVQPERDEVNILVRAGGANHLLLLSASADCARAHITAQKKTGPLEPPALCTLLRKYLLGSRLLSVKQKYADRILEIRFEHYDELGDLSQKALVCEFMGKHSNIIFIGADGRILESTRHVSELMSSVREVLPGLRYEDPPAHGKIPYDRLEPGALAEALRLTGGPLWKALARTVSGLSPLAAREIAWRATGSDEAHLDECDAAALSVSVCDALRSMLEADAPQLLVDDAGAPVEFSAWPLLSRSAFTSQPCSTLSEAIDRYYQGRDAAMRLRQKSAALHKLLKTNIERCERKLALQREALLGSERMDEYRLWGELLNANLHLAQKGEKEARVPDYYQADMPLITIPLDVKLSPAQNAQRYFKLYQKARSAKTLAAEQIALTEDELRYLEGQLINLDNCQEEAELSEIREELEKQGYARPDRNRRRMKQLPPSKPLRYLTRSGRLVLVGKNNLQNDKLTFSAQPDEIWLHAKDMPGSHVILPGDDPAPEDILDAARLAAAHSKAGASSQVPIDYTRRRYVKKPSGAKPGFVIYTHQKTLYVSPEDQPRAAEDT